MHNKLSRNEENIYYAWISSQLGVGSAAFKRLYNFYGSGKNIFECTDYSGIKLTDNQREKLMEKDLSVAKKSIDSALYSGFIPVSYENDKYPQNLKEISNPPPIFYIRGKLLDFDKYYCVGVVGTRKPSKESMDFIKDISYSLAKEGVIIISGLAFGIDSEAHTAAIQANGFTVGVSGVKAGQIYPRENEFLYSTMYKCGAVICEHSPTDTVEKSSFPIRNRIISALSHALIMAEAPSKSGALITAEKSLSLKKPVFVPLSTMKSNEGGRILLQKGAYPLNSKEDITNVFIKIKNTEFLKLQEFPKYNFDTSRFTPEHPTINSPLQKSTENEVSEISTPIDKKSTDKTIPELSDIENSVYNYILKERSVSTDQIIKELNLTSIEAASCASMLEIYGYVRRMPGDKWSIL